MLNRMIFVILTALTALIPISPASAQMRGAGSVTAGVGITTRPAPGRMTVSDGSVAGPARFHHGRAFGPLSILYPYPYFYPDYADNTQEAAPPRVAVAPAAASAQPAAPAPPLEPLLIEWQGDHFERMTLSQKASAGGQRGPDYSAKYAVRSSAAPSTLSTTRKVVAQPPPELPPAVLVFRDGRTEEVSSYTIMSGTIYSKADYWTSGSWTRKIQIADLDVPATLTLNREHGLNFVLPAGPNEIVMRP